MADNWLEKQEEEMRRRKSGAVPSEVRRRQWLRQLKAEQERLKKEKDK